MTEPGQFHAPAMPSVSERLRRGLSWPQSISVSPVPSTSQIFLKFYLLYNVVLVSASQQGE